MGKVLQFTGSKPWRCWCGIENTLIDLRCRKCKRAKPYIIPGGKSKWSLPKIR